MEKTFFLRVDVESHKGIKEGLPNLLDLLKKYNIKASFYLVMGGESNIFELIKYRSKLSSSTERSISLWSLKDKLRMVFLPRDFVNANKPILNRILDEGHELGIHGWKHRAWSRGLDKININEHIVKAKTKYKKIFNREALSFCSPAFNTNQEVMKCLEKNNFKFISDFPDTQPKLYGSIKNVPVTITGDHRTPIIEFFISQGKTDQEITEVIKEKIINKNLASFYIHDLFEARFKLNILEDIFKFLKKNNIKIKRVIDF